ncbi:serine dehydratase subunit alpha family protein [Natranaerobius trueperi]|nr:L-serine ammonia-lyase, iron-sulfur-dependent, subunit alpha [Natranaerobius trueperi]
MPKNIITPGRRLIQISYNFKELKSETGGMLLEKIEIINTLKEDNVVAAGCTEPVAVGLAAAAAYEQVEGTLIKVEVWTDPNIYKNGLGVVIPGTQKAGLNLAAALGSLIGQTDKNLEIFSDVKYDFLNKAQKLIEQDKVIVNPLDKKSPLYVEAIVSTDKGTGKAIIKESHDNITYLECNGKPVYKKDINTAKSKDQKINYSEFNIAEFIELVESIDLKKIQFLNEGIQLNMKIAEYGLNKSPGFGVGSKISNLIANQKLPSDLSNKIKAWTAAACDARMSGVNLPVMSCSGSGNQGIMTTIPLAITASELDCTHDQLLKARAIAIILTNYIKHHIGNLSAICGGAVAASIGASAGIAYLLKGSTDQIVAVIDNIIANNSGVVCDGAKPSCAIKLMTAADLSYQTALLSVNGLHISCGNGIIVGKTEKTVQNLGQLSREGMEKTDETIFKIMF